MPLSICSDSEEEERPRSAKTSVDLPISPWPNNLVSLEDVSHNTFTVKDANSTLFFGLRELNFLVLLRSISLKDLRSR